MLTRRREEEERQGVAGAGVHKGWHPRGRSTGGATCCGRLCLATESPICDRLKSIHLNFYTESHLREQDYMHFLSQSHQALKLLVGVMIYDVEHRNGPGLYLCNRLHVYVTAIGCCAPVFCAFLGISYISDCFDVCHH